MDVSLAATFFRLVLLGPIAALAVAQFTGGLTWTRVLLWTVGCQALVILLFLRPGSLPTIVYPTKPGAATTTGWGGEAGSYLLLYIVVITVGMLAAAVLTPVARWVARWVARR
jgi:hypothetical protein